LVRNQIRIKRIKAKELRDFTRAALSCSNYRDILPISPARALAHSKNPYAEKEDVVLLLAYKDGRCVGYHGLLPGLLQYEGNFFPVFWGSTFFVSKRFRGMGIGTRLLENIKSLNVDFVVTGMTDEAKKVLKSFGLKRLGQLSYCQIRLDRIKIFDRLCSSLADSSLTGELKRRKHLLIPGPMVERFHRFKKKLFYRLMLSRMTRNVKDFSHEQVRQINNPGEAADPESILPRFYRGADLINWMLRYQWVQSLEGIKKEGGPYYFSDVREVFQYIALEIHSAKRERYKGFLVLSLSRTPQKTVVKILDFNFKNPEDSKIACLLSLKYAGAVLADRIEFPLCLESGFTCRFMLKPFLRKQKRLYLFCPKDGNSPLARSAGKMALKFCDGDTPFS
jgi:GNAT superfamily N-acetyltransferase